MSEPRFRFPLLAFTTDLAIWSLGTADELATCGPMTLRDHLQVGMDVVDPDGNCWRVRSVRRVGPAPFSLRTLFHRPSKIDHEWEERPRLSLSELKDRVCISIAAHADCFLHFPDDADELAKLHAEIRAADSIVAIGEMLGLDGFQGH